MSRGGDPPSLSLTSQATHKCHLPKAHVDHPVMRCEVVQNQPTIIGLMTGFFCGSALSALSAMIANSRRLQKAFSVNKQSCRRRKVLNEIAPHWLLTWLKCRKAAACHLNKGIPTAQYFTELFCPTTSPSKLALFSNYKNPSIQSCVANPTYNFHSYCHGQQTLKITIRSYMFHTKYFKPYLIFQSQI